MDDLLLRNAPKGQPIPEDDNDFAWQRRYSWIVQAALSSGENMTPAEAGIYARGVVSREYEYVNSGSDLPGWLANE